MAAGLQPRFRVFLCVVAVLGLAFIGIQFVHPEIKNPPVTADLQAPAEVKQILKTSCYNCHSNETKVPWFDKIAPAYWLVSSDVGEGRKSLNFSEIGKLPSAQQRAILFEAVNQIQLGAMPLPAYRRVHPGSVVTEEQLTVLRNYLNPSSASAITATGLEGNTANTQYEKWIQASKNVLHVSPAPNGIAFFPDYKNWKSISSTERFDNHSMRAILGNDVAVKAIAENHINPWPDGTAFAKVAWLEQSDDQGTIRPGAFWQVEFMIRDSKKYASTRGWGWARWRGDNLKPYGKDASFSNECISCHTPVRKNDYVFTMPLKGQL
jgi:Haem-binding domain/Cytochrome P460